MDPDACMDRLLDAAEAEDFSEVMAAVDDLRRWIITGGFPPKLDGPRARRLLTCIGRMANALGGRLD